MSNPVACRAHPPASTNSRQYHTTPRPVYRAHRCSVVQSVYLFLFLNLLEYGQAGRIRLALELEKESALRGKEEGCGMRYDIRVGAVHGRENEGHGGGDGFRYMRACGRVTARPSKRSGGGQLTRRTNSVVLPEKAQHCARMLWYPVFPHAYAGPGGRHARHKAVVASKGWRARVDSEDTHRAGGCGATAETERADPEFKLD
ncbi:hypothetical protein B0H16DRAFT_1765083 [Mycena metata]|uniref:Uncharacterized protein n=1 Tax=Mycena metata TaxID=1033252 RepID=A0AAD7MWB4_9AGAR|nr:hypothetical protein B0H16DRAFT_1765083 [Mycena metata]